MRTCMRAAIAFFSAVFFVLGGLGLLTSESLALSVGSRVQTTDQLTVRSTANGTIVGYQANGSQGTVIAGPVSSGSYQWAKVNYDTGVDGWSATNWLQEVSANTSNVSNATANTANTTLAPSTFPLELRSTTLPEEKTVTFNTAINAEATNAVVSMNVYDPDFANEGVLYINGRGSIFLFGDQGVIANDTLTKTLTFNTPVSWWNNGSNSLRFVHTSTTGFTINSLSVSFPGGFPPPPSTPTTPSGATTKPSFKYGTASGGLVVGMNDLLTLTVDAGPEGDLQLYKLTFYARTSNATLSYPTFAGPNGSVGRVEISAGAPNLITVYFDNSNNPTDSIIQAGFSKTFTLRASVSIPTTSLTSGLSVGLKGDISRVSLSPVSSLVSSNVIWSPMTSTKSRIALTSADWTNSYALSGGCHAQAGVGQDCLPRSLQNIDRSPAGSLYIDSINFRGGEALAGIQSHFLGEMILSATGEPIILQQVGLQLYSGLPSNISNITLWDDATLVGRANFLGTNTRALATLSVPVVVNPKTSNQLGKKITIRGDVGRVGVGYPASSDSLNLVSVDANDASLTFGSGQTSGQKVALVSVPRPPTGSGFRVLKSFPREIGAISGYGTGVNGSNDLINMNVLADGSGDIRLGRIAFSIQTKNATVSNLTFAGPNGRVTANTISAVVGPNTTQTVYIPFDSSTNSADKVIAAGQIKSYVLRGNITPGSGEATVVTTLLGDDAASNPSLTGEPLQKYKALIAQSPNRNFVWSPLSTTSSVTWENNDWLASWQLTNFSFANVYKKITFNGTVSAPVSTEIYLTGPDQNQYSIPSSIPISYKIGNAPANSQVFVSAALEKVDPTVSPNGTSGFSGQTKLIPVGSSNDTYMWDASTEYLAGLYRIDARVQQCDPRGCEYNVFPATPTVFAKSTPVYVTLQSSKPAVTANITVNGNIQGQVIYRGESVAIAWSSQNASSCDVLETYSNYKQNSLSGSWTRTPTKTTNYAIQCINSSWAGPGDTKNIVSRSVLVEVKDPAPVSEPPPPSEPLPPITPPATTTNCSSNQVLVYSKPGEFDLPVPVGCYGAEVFVWGAGGAGAANESGVGGSGGYTRGRLTLTDLRNLKILVGQGGNNAGQASVGGGGVGTYRSDYKAAYGGSGGGLSGVFSGSITQSNVLLVAGAGGGAGKCGATTGGGAGVKGLERSAKVSGEIGGGGASLTSGGSATLPGQAGAALKGGNGGKDGAAGGGGGYYGGGGGSGLCSSGGGGSGYYPPSSSVVSGQEIKDGTNGGGNGLPQTVVAGSSSQYYAAPAGYGGSASTPAGDGRVVVVFTSGKGALPGPVFTTSTQNTNQMAAVLESIRTLLEKIKQQLGF